MPIPPEDIPLDPSTLVRLGRIASVDEGAGRCTVRYGAEEDGAEAATTPPIRWITARAGTTRTRAAPSVGEEVLLLTPGGQLGLAVAIGGLNNAGATPPGAPGTLAFEAADGALLAYDPAIHALTATLPAGATALIEAPGGITLRGDVTIEGALTVTEDATAQGTSLHTHTHGNVQAGIASSGPPQ